MFFQQKAATDLSFNEENSHGCQLTSSALIVAIVVVVNKLMSISRKFGILAKYGAGFERQFMYMWFLCEILANVAANWHVAMAQWDMIVCAWTIQS